MIPENSAVIVRVHADDDPEMKWWAVIDQRRIMSCQSASTLTGCVSQFNRRVRHAFVAKGIIPASNLDDFAIKARRRGGVLEYEEWPSLQ